MDRKNKIGVFDSGVGGLNVLSNLIKDFPNEDFLYFGLFGSLLQRKEPGAGIGSDQYA